MITTAIGILLVFTVIIIVALAMVQKQLAELKDSKQSDQSAQLLNQNIQGMSQRLDETTKSLNERLDKAASYIATTMGTVSQTIGEVGKGLGSVQQIGQDLKRFQEVLNAPKLRGNLGEHILAESLAQVFPREQFGLQHKFRAGETVDAVLKTESGFIPIDSKFPLEQWRARESAADDAARKTAEREFVRAVKKHVDDIAKKYILPSEGTVDFAVMYVPSDAVFYDIVLASEELMEHARGRKILLVSPNGFAHFLRTVYMGLERGKIAKEAMQVWELLKTVQTEVGKFGEAIQLVNRHVTNAKNAVDAASTEYVKLAGKVERVEALAPAPSTDDAHISLPTA
ncbi:DNA recombination protein RmuC [Candidatus Uhrbacteria bacterium]|nr:DNA recombination protein RmuC [Candidatus Uhrbacteria bacterium]